MLWPAFFFSFLFFFSNNPTFYVFCLWSFKKTLPLTSPEWRNLVMIDLSIQHSVIPYEFRWSQVKECTGHFHWWRLRIRSEVLNHFIFTDTNRCQLECLKSHMWRYAKKCLLKTLILYMKIISKIVKIKKRFTKWYLCYLFPLRNRSLEHIL